MVMVVRKQSGSRSLDILGEAVTLGNRGLIEVNGVAIAEVDSKDLDAFVTAKQGSIPFREAMTLMRESTFKDRSFSGPRAVKENLTSINDSGTDIGNNHLQWVKNSNVNPRTSVVHEHRNLTENVSKSREKSYGKKHTQDSTPQQQKPSFVL